MRCEPRRSNNSSSTEMNRFSKERVGSWSSVPNKDFWEYSKAGWARCFHRGLSRGSITQSETGYQKSLRIQDARTLQLVSQGIAAKSALNYYKLTF